VLQEEKKNINSDDKNFRVTKELSLATPDASGSTSGLESVSSTHLLSF